MSSSRDKLRLSDPMGSAPKGNVVRDRISIEDQLAERAQLIENEKRIAQLERSNAKLEAQLSQIEPAVPNGNATGQEKVSHIAHSEGWQAICTSPDFCKVGNAVVAFNSFATLDMQQTASPNVKARGTAVYRKGDMIKKVQGDAGKHIVSGTSLGSGHVKILDGHDNVKVNGIPVARHDSRCLINCDATGVGGAQGKLVTERKSVGGGGSKLKDPAPPGERTSDKLAALKRARASVADGMLDLDALDEYVNFDQSNQALSDLIAQISGTRGTAVGYVAEVTRGVLGFCKDMVLGAGELAYEGVKAVPKVVELIQTQKGRVLAQLDAKILGEHIKLGNITPETVARRGLDVGKAIVKPVTDPWAKGDYVESITRSVTEVGTIGLGWIKGSRAAKAAKAAEAAKTGRASAGAGTKATSVADVARPAQTLPRHVDDGVHIARAKSRVATKPNTAFFWSGRSLDEAGNKVGGAERAAEIALKNKGTTLETLIKERKIEMPNWDPNNPVAVKQWEDISAEYASGVSGEVSAVIGNELRPGNIWMNKELPALMKNPNVTKITTIDPVTGIKLVVFP